MTYIVVQSLETLLPGVLDHAPVLVEELELASQGLTTKVAAMRRGVTQGVSHANRSQILTALDANNMPHAVRIAIEKNILPITPIIDEPVELPPSCLAVLLLASEGKNVGEMAKVCGVATSTVKDKRTIILDRLEAFNMSNAIRRAYELGLLPRDSD